MAETFTVLELSTAHVTEEVAAVLDRELDHRAQQEPCFPPWTWEQSVMGSILSEYGWWLYANDDPGMWPDFPECLQAIFALAKDLGASWIKFDRDADPIEELPTYEW